MPEYNGKSSGTFPEKFIIFDLETSCLNSKCAEIIEIAALKVSSGEIIQTFNSLIKPKNGISADSTTINGITEEMVKDAPTASEVLTDFIDFIENLPLIGHNISSYDLPILRRCVSELFEFEIVNNHIDTLYLAKERLDSIPNYKLGTIAAYFAINVGNAHRALSDCLVTKQCYDKLVKLPVCVCKQKIASHRHRTLFTEETKALQELQGFLLGITADDVLVDAEVFSLKKWLDKHSSLAGNYPFDRVFSAIEKALDDGYLSQDERDELLVLFKNFSSPVDNRSCETSDFNFSGKIICLSGDFRFGSKKTVEDILAKVGGTCKSSVTKKTSYVIVGSNGSADWTCGNYGTKIKKALELQAQGVEIQIIKEEELTAFFNSERK